MKLPHIGRLMLTHADFPQQDWAEWRRQEVDESPDNDGATIDTNYLKVMPCCIHCATWICSGCMDFHRSRATRRVSQYCPKCGGVEGFFVAIRHLKPHEALPTVPFRVPRMTRLIRGLAAKEALEGLRESTEALARAGHAISTGQPAGGPCRTCGEGDPVHHNQLVARGFIHHKWNEGEPMDMKKAETEWMDARRSVIQRLSEPQGEKMHVPEEADMAKGLIQTCGYSCLTDGVNYPECPVHGPLREVHTGELDDELEEKEAAEEAAEQEELYKVQQPQVVEILLGKLREAGENGLDRNSLVTLKVYEAKELCDLAKNPLRPVEYPYVDGDFDVIGPGVLLDADEGVISFRGKNYYHRQITEADRKLIAANSRATIERRDRERAEERRAQMREHLRREAMQWAVELNKDNNATANPSAKASAVIQTADRIIEWLTKD